MNQVVLPLWTQYIQAIGPAFVAIIAAFIAGYIAWRQWTTAEKQLRLAMFDKRFAVYEAIRVLANTAIIAGQIQSDDLAKFYSGVRGAEFLFRGDTKTFVHEVGIKAAKAMVTRVSAEKQSDGAKRRQELIDEEEVLLEFIRRADLENLFAPYLDLSRAGLLS